MQIQILNVSKTPAMSKANKPYTFLDMAFKNLTFQGKIEGKKLMPFGANAAAYNALEHAKSGDVYEITVFKNEAGFNDWTAAHPAEAGAQAAPGQVGGTQQGQVYQGSKAAAAPARTNSFETPEERAKKQIYIVRQSSLSAAINSLSPGAKSTLKSADVIALAKEYEAYVFDSGEAQMAAQNAVEQEFEDIPD